MKASDKRPCSEKYARAIGSLATIFSIFSLGIVLVHLDIAGFYVTIVLDIAVTVLKR